MRHCARGVTTGGVSTASGLIAHGGMVGHHLRDRRILRQQVPLYIRPRLVLPAILDDGFTPLEPTRGQRLPGSVSCPFRPTQFGVMVGIIDFRLTAVVATLASLRAFCRVWYIWRSYPLCRMATSAGMYNARRSSSRKPPSRISASRRRTRAGIWASPVKPADSWQSTERKSAFRQQSPRRQQVQLPERMSGSQSCAPGPDRPLSGQKFRHRSA